MSYEELESIESMESSSYKHHCCTSGCICKVVRAIKDIQDQAVEEDCPTCPSNCFIEPLGDLNMPARAPADTRVFTLTFKNGELLKGFFKGVPGNCASIYFRVEEIFDNCCATLRVLLPLDKARNPVPIFQHGKLNYETLCTVRNWASTSSCITVDLHCFCAIQCIADINLELCE